MTEKKMIKI